MMRTLRAVPTLLRISLTESFAWRAELFIWILATTMPLVMMPLWMSVTRGGPVQGMNENDVRAYFLATFIIRQLGSVWASWQINMEVRQGTLSMRLLKPFPPLAAYAIECLGALPLRLSVALPLAVAMLVHFASGSLADTPVEWAMLAASIVLAWLLTFSVQVGIGALSFWFESSTKLSEAWTAGYFVLSGYLVPPQMFPPAMQRALDWLPFRYQLGLPVELLTSRHDLATAGELLTRQAGFVLVFGTLATLVWRAGVKRFGAFGG